MALYKFEDHSPVLPPSGLYFIAPGVRLIGKVKLEEDANIWFNAILRGDNEWISIGPRANVQDNCVLHTDPGCPLSIGAEASIGHSVILHGCTIGEGALIGMGTTILNRARIGKNCIVGANALITEGKEFPDNSLIVGAPAVVIKTLDEARAMMGRMTAAVYLEKSKRFRASLERLPDHA